MYGCMELSSVDVDRIAESGSFEYGFAERERWLLITLGSSWVILLVAIAEITATNPSNTTLPLNISPLHHLSPKTCFASSENTLIIICCSLPSARINTERTSCLHVNYLLFLLIAVDTT